MNVFQHIFLNILVLSALTVPFLSGSETGPAGGGSGRSGSEAPPCDAHRLLNSDEAVAAFEDAIVGTVRQFISTIKLNYRSGSVLPIMQIIADINASYEAKYKESPITPETPIQQYVHGDMASTAFFLYYAGFKRDLLAQPYLTQPAIRNWIEAIVSLGKSSTADAIKTLPNVTLIRDLNECIQRCEERQRYYAPLLEHMPKEDSDSKLKALLLVVKNYASIKQTFISDARHMLQIFCTAISTKTSVEPASTMVPRPLKTAPPAEHPIMRAIKEQVTHYCAKIDKECGTKTSAEVVTAIASYLQRMTPEAFASQLCREQKTLLAQSKGYQACAHILSKAKNSLLTAMREDTTYTDEEINAIIHSLIYALATDLIYSHLQQYETTADIRRNIREHLGVCPPESPTPWHQDILGPKELPHFSVVAATQVADIMDMVHRWSITDIIQFFRDLLEKQNILAEDASSMDAYLIDTLLPLRTYVFSDEQKAAILNDEKRAAQNKFWGTLRKAIRAKQEGYDGFLLNDLLHQTIIINMLALLDADNMPADTKSALKGMPCFQLPKAPKAKKGQRRRK
jgi:hypothetical protein